MEDNKRTNLVVPLGPSPARPLRVAEGVQAVLSPRPERVVRGFKWMSRGAGEGLATPAKQGVARSKLRGAGWAFLSIGLAATATGAALLGIEGQPACELHGEQARCPEQWSTQTEGIVAASGAGLALLSGGILLWLGYRSHQERP